MDALQEREQFEQSPLRRCGHDHRHRQSQSLMEKVHSWYLKNQANTNTRTTLWGVTSCVEKHLDILNHHGGRPYRHLGPPSPAAAWRTQNPRRSALPFLNFRKQSLLPQKCCSPQVDGSAVTVNCQMAHLSCGSDCCMLLPRRIGANPPEIAKDFPFPSIYVFIQKISVKI